MSILKYKKIEKQEDSSKRLNFSDGELALINNTFSTLFFNHSLYVIDPQDIFPKESLKNFEKNGYDLDFNNVKISCFKDYKKAGKYYTNHEATKVFSKIWLKYHNAQRDARKNKNFKYNQSFIIAEEDENNNFMIRSIVKVSETDFQIAVNPEHEQRMSYLRAQINSHSLQNAKEAFSLETYFNKIKQTRGHQPNNE